MKDLQVSAAQVLQVGVKLRQVIAEYLVCTDSSEGFSLLSMITGITFTLTTFGVNKAMINEMILIGFSEEQQKSRRFRFLLLA